MLKIRGEINKSDAVASLLATRAVQNQVQEFEENLAAAYQGRAFLSEGWQGMASYLDALIREISSSNRKLFDMSRQVLTTEPLFGKDVRGRWTVCSTLDAPKGIIGCFCV